MGNRAGHLEKASHNAGFLKDLTQDENAFVDWVVTVAFYVALHFVDAALALFNIHPENHQIRNKQVSTRFRAVATKYMRLYVKSRHARYDIDSHKIISWDDAMRLAKSASNDFRSIP